MNSITQITTPTIAGTPCAGGFYVGRFVLDGAEYALIVAPKALGEHQPTAWGEYGQNIEGARSCNDGRANTEAMAAAGSALGQWALTLDIADHKDWYIPSRDELELCYRNLKPTTQENWACFRDGDNPSSVPVGYPYTEESPVQTTAAEFQEGGPEAFQPEWYYASTQSSPNAAWIQVFDDGTQNGDRKDDARRAVAVRRYKITP